MATLLVCDRCAYTTIVAAVRDAQDGDVIEVAVGFYAESVVIVRSLSIRPMVGRRTRP